MDEVRSAEWMTDSQRVRDELGELDATQRRAILWGLRRNPAAMNGLRQQAKRAARGFRTAANQPTSTPSPTCVWASSPISPSPHLPVSPSLPSCTPCHFPHALSFIECVVNVHSKGNRAAISQSRKTLINSAQIVVVQPSVRL